MAAAGFYAPVKARLAFLPEGFSLPVGLGTAFLHSRDELRQKWYRDKILGLMVGHQGLPPRCVQWVAIRRAWACGAGLSFAVCRRKSSGRPPPEAPVPRPPGPPTQAPAPDLPRPPDAAHRDYWLSTASGASRTGLLRLQPGDRQPGPAAGPGARGAAPPLRCSGQPGQRRRPPAHAHGQRPVGRRRTDILLLWGCAGFRRPSRLPGRLGGGLLTSLTFCYSGEGALLPARVPTASACPTPGSTTAFWLLGMSAPAAWGFLCWRGL